jgi:hypothetical protein
MSLIVKGGVPLLLFSAASVANAGLVFTDTWTNPGTSDPYPVQQFETGTGTPPIPDSTPVVNNQLSVTTQDNGTNSSYFPTEGGASLPGSPLNATSNSFSGLYNFMWQTTDSTDGTSPAVDTSTLGNEYEFVGFKGTNINQNRQIMGSFVSHDFKGGHYLLYIEPAFESEGNTDTAEIKPVTTLDLGTSLPANMQYAIGWDAPTQTVHMQFLMNGVVIEDESSAIQHMFGAHPAPYDNATNIALEESELAITHLGWTDYTGNANDLETHWLVNSLSYYNDSTGAFVPVPEPTTLGLLASCTGLLALRRQSRRRAH